MKKQWQILIKLVAVICLVALVASACAPAKPVVEKEIKIGLSLCITGPIASIGVPTSTAMLDYLAYVNAGGGVEYRAPGGEIDRVKLAIIWEDHAYNVPKTISIYKRHKAAGVICMVVWGSVPGDTVAGFASRDQIAVFGHYGTLSSVILRLNPLYYTAAVAGHPELCGVSMKWIADTWTEDRPARIGLILADVPTRRPIVEPQRVPRLIEELGLELVGVEWLPMFTSDATIELTRIMGKEPDFLYLDQTPAGVMVVIKDMIRLGVKGKARYVIPNYAYDESLVRFLSEQADGLYGQLMTALPHEDVAGVHLARTLCQEYRDKEPTLLYLTGLAMTMGFVEGLKLALDEVGLENLTSSAINDGLHSIKNFDTQGLYPPFTVDPSYPLTMPKVKFGVIDSGKFKSISNWYEYPRFFVE